MNWGAAATKGGSPQLAENGEISVRFPRPGAKQIRALGGAARNWICVLSFAESPIHYQKSENLEAGFASFRDSKKWLLEPSRPSWQGFGMGQNGKRNANCINCQILVSVVLHATSLLHQVIDFLLGFSARQNF